MIQEMPVRIDIEEIIKLKIKMDYINSFDIKHITFYQENKPVEISKNILDKWRYVGLNNMDFITMGFYNDLDDELF